jgi:hypothetical protein
MQQQEEWREEIINERQKESLTDNVKRKPLKEKILIADFVLMVALGNVSCCRVEHYVGTFSSCVEAHEYIKNHIPKAQRNKVFAQRIC